MPGHDGIRLAWTLLEGRLFEVKAQVGLPHFRIGTMTTEAIAGQNGLHILVEVKMLPRLSGMAAVAARGCCQQGHRYHRGWHYFRGQVAGLRTIGDRKRSDL